MFIGHERLARDFERLISENALGHGYLFFGPRRVGKRLFAISLARMLEQGDFSESGEGRPPLGDMLLIAPKEGAAGIGIDEIRELKQFLSQTPFTSPRRTAIVNDAQLLTDEAQNALLKITEEPPRSALILLVTDDPESLKTTLRSRFAQVSFSAISAAQMATWLAQRGLKEKEAADIARKAKGHPGLAWMMLYDDQFRTRLSSARDFLAAAPARRMGIAKELAAEDDFVLAEFLEALMIEAAERKDPRFWHAVLELQREDSLTNLNPKLQLMALAKILV